MVLDGRYWVGWTVGSWSILIFGCRSWVSGGLVFLIVGLLELCCFGFFGLCIFWCFLLNYTKPDKRQESNDYLSFAIDVYKDLFVGHVPVEMSSLCYHFLNNNE